MVSESVAKYIGVLLLLFLTASGMTMIIGTARRWPALVDPPLDKYPNWGHTRIKRILGAEVLPMYNYVTGVLLICVPLQLLILLFVSFPTE